MGHRGDTAARRASRATRARTCSGAGLRSRRPSRQLRRRRRLGPGPARRAQPIRAAVELPLVATGGTFTAARSPPADDGRRRGELGTAFMRTPEAGTSPAHRAALAATTRPPSPPRSPAASARGRQPLHARAPVDAPAGYPEIHHLTAPLRAAAREEGDADGFHLWAGQAHALAEELPAGELVRRLAADAAERCAGPRAASTPTRPLSAHASSVAPAAAQAASACSRAAPRVTACSPAEPRRRGLHHDPDHRRPRRGPRGR